MGYAISELPASSFLVFDRELRFALVRGEALLDNDMNPADFEGRLASEALSPDRWAVYEPMYRAALRGESTEGEVRSPDGRREYLVRTRPVIDHDGTILGGVLAASEITALRSAQRRALESERRFALAMQVAPIGMAVVSLDRIFVEVNDALCQMLSAQPSDLIGQSLSLVLHPDDDPRDLAARAAVIAGDSVGATQEKRLVSLDGRELWVQHSVGLLRDSAGEPLHYVSQFVDVSEARQTRRRLEDLAARDQLTQLHNRLSLDRLVTGWFGPGQPATAVLFIDLDGFKRVNDSLGHVAGDQVLRVVADRLANRLRPDDVVARFGGDEFVVAIRGSDLEQMGAVSRHLHDAMSQAMTVEGQQVTIGLSIGAALARPGEEFGNVLRRADRCLYRAKAAGGFCTVVDETIVDELAVEPSAGTRR